MIFSAMRKDTATPLSSEPLVKRYRRGRHDRGR
jgi:hypothetical protein